MKTTTVAATVLTAWWFIAWSLDPHAWQIVGPFRELDQCLAIQRFVADHGLSVSVCGLDNPDQYDPWKEPMAP